MTTTEKLLPCPCCKSMADILEITDDCNDNFGAKFIECRNSSCGMTTPMIFPCMEDVDEKLTKIWNTRAPIVNAPEPYPVGVDEGYAREEWHSKHDAPVTRNTGVNEYCDKCGGKDKNCPYGHIPLNDAPVGEAGDDDLKKLYQMVCVQNGEWDAAAFMANWLRGTIKIPQNVIDRIVSTSGHLKDASGLVEALNGVREDIENGLADKYTVAEIVKALKQYQESGE